MSGTEQPQIDTSRPSIARVYDVFLGGKDNFEVDRAVYQQIVQIAPEARTTGLQCRAWLIRVVSFLAGAAGIDQFLDCGSGLPTAENTHQAAQRINPKATVVYVDNDPSVAAHGRALLEENDRTHFGVADLREPTTLLNSPAVADNLDFDRPVALIQCNTLHHVADEDKPSEIMAAYVDALPAGSYVAICHLHDPADGSSRSALARDAQARFMSLMGTCRFRTREEIQSFFCGQELIEPGLTYPYLWRPDTPQVDEATDEAHLLLGGVARVS
ncbi:MAG TPA: SAM-dependent methyltransferase [Pseudonocardiaceae bacterium]|nr:SAM-dependent methyltransferase [Pseudonocardiaceae bacterium]